MIISFVLVSLVHKRRTDEQAAGQPATA
jgi:hypothetical protein